MPYATGAGKSKLYQCEYGFGAAVSTVQNMVPAGIDCGVTAFSANLSSGTATTVSIETVSGAVIWLVRFEVAGPSVEIAFTHPLFSNDGLRVNMVGTTPVVYFSIAWINYESGPGGI